MRYRDCVAGCGIGLLCVLGSVGMASAQSGGVGATSPEMIEREAEDPRRATMERMMRPVDAVFEEESLRSVLDRLAEGTGVEFAPVYISERREVGLDPELPITMTLEREPAINAIERILDEATTDDFDAPTWQLTNDGRIELGPRSALNRRKYTKVYYVHDIVFDVPNFRPKYSVNTNIQGFNNSSTPLFGMYGSPPPPPTPYHDNLNVDNLLRMVTNEVLVDHMLELLRFTVEPDQWRDNGGRGGSLRMFDGHLVVNGPGYIHRQIGGWDFMPEGYEAFENEQRRTNRLAVVVERKLEEKYGEEAPRLLRPEDGSEEPDEAESPEAPSEEPADLTPDESEGAPPTD